MTKYIFRSSQKEHTNSFGISNETPFRQGNGKSGKKYNKSNPLSILNSYECKIKKKKFKITDE